MDIWRLPATELASLIKSRKVSAMEAATAALGRLDAVNPTINAVVDHRPDDVLAQARQIDDALARNQDPGPLAGVPVTIKVNIDQTGFANTNGITLQRDLIAKTNSPVIDNLRKAGAVILGRTNTPAFSYRWFTKNLVHGHTKNPRDPAITPGGSSGGAASSLAAGIGHIAHGTDIAGSIRYPAYACGVHGLRTTLGRVAAWNASGAERSICPQIAAVSGPLARTIGDLRIALAAMSQPDARDPWWVPAPLEGPPVPKYAALCISPDGLEVVDEVKAALRDAAKRLERAGWTVEEITKTPPLKEAADIQTKLWLGDGYEAMLAAAEREGDPGALACLRGNRSKVHPFDSTALSQALTRRATLTRDWQTFFETYPVLLMPVSGELPFPDQLDVKDDASFARVWRAQMPMVGIPLMGLPGLTVSTGLVGRVPVGVQVVAGRYREDLCLLAGEAIEAGGPPHRRSILSLLDCEVIVAGVFDFSATTLTGEPCALSQFEGHALLIVNTASACGFTPQYKDLEDLYRTMKPRGFSVLGFPCNQFGHQEPGSSADIQQFCASKYDVTFPMFEKIDVNGSDAHPLFKYLKREKTGLLGESIKWNFTKFLVDRRGTVVARHAPTTNPKTLTRDIEALL